MRILDYKSIIGCALVNGEWKHTTKEQLIILATALNLPQFNDFAKFGLDALRGRQRSALNAEKILKNISPPDDSDF